MGKKRNEDKTRRSRRRERRVVRAKRMFSAFSLIYEGVLTGLYGGGRHSSRPVHIPRPAAYFVADLR